MAYLEVLGGRHRGARLRLKRDESLIGNRWAAQIPLRDDGVAEEHARIVCENGHYRLEDLGGGTRIHDEPVDSRVLEDGDVVRVGGVDLRFHLDDPGTRRWRRRARGEAIAEDDPDREERLRSASDRVAKAVEQWPESGDEEEVSGSARHPVVDDPGPGSVETPADPDPEPEPEPEGPPPSGGSSSERYLEESLRRAHERIRELEETQRELLRSIREKERSLDEAYRLMAETGSRQSEQFARLVELMQETGRTRPTPDDAPPAREDEPAASSPAPGSVLRYEPAAREEDEIAPARSTGSGRLREHRETETDASPSGDGQEEESEERKLKGAVPGTEGKRLKGAVPGTCRLGEEGEEPGTPPSHEEIVERRRRKQLERQRRTTREMETVDLDGSSSDETDSSSTSVSRRLSTIEDEPPVRRGRSMEVVFRTAGGALLLAVIALSIYGIWFLVTGAGDGGGLPLPSVPASEHAGSGTPRGTPVDPELPGEEPASEEEPDATGAVDGPAPPAADGTVEESTSPTDGAEPVEDAPDDARSGHHDPGGGGGALDGLVSRLEEATAGGRERDVQDAVSAIERLGAGALADVARRYRSHPDPAVKRALRDAMDRVLGELPPDELFARLRGEGDFMVKQFAQLELTRREDLDPAMLQEIARNDSDTRAQIAAIRALQSSDDPTASRALGTLARTRGNQAVQLEAVRVLGQVGSDTAREVMLDLAGRTDGNATVRDTAIVNLGEFEGDDQVVVALEDLLDRTRDEPDVMAKVLLSLGKVGGEAQIERIRSIREEESNPRVRHRARQAIQRIEARMAADAR